jgi:hypothetical protein
MRMARLCLACLCACAISASCTPSTTYMDPPTPTRAALEAEAARAKVELLRESLYGEDAESRLTAAVQIVSMKDAVAFDEIVGALNCGNAQVQKSVLRAISETREAKFIEPIAALVVGKSAEAIDESLLDVMLFVDAQRTSAVFVTHLETAGLPEASTRNLMQALASTRTKDAAGYIIGRLKGLSGENMAVAVNALQELTGLAFDSESEWRGWWEKNKQRSREQWLEQALIACQQQIKKERGRASTLNPSMSAGPPRRKSEGSCRCRRTN